MSDADQKTTPPAMPSAAESPEVPRQTIGQWAPKAFCDRASGQLFENGRLVQLKNKQRHAASGEPHGHLWGADE